MSADPLNDAGVFAQPIEIEIIRHHPYKNRKPTPGCAQCGSAKYHPNHLGHATSYNALGSGSQWTYQAMKQGWQEALAQALDVSGLRRGNQSRIVVEGEMCFPTRNVPDQGNARFILEKALGDALVHGFPPDIEGGWLPDDNWEMYSFGDLAYRYEKGQSWTRLMLFPTGGVYVLARAA